MIADRHWLDILRETKGQVVTVIINFFNRLEVVNGIFQFLYFFGLIGVAGWGVFVAIPVLYADYDVNTTWWMQAFGCFVALQLSINWLCIRFVSSNYVPYIHGAMPDGVYIGHNIYKQRIIDANQNGDYIYNNTKTRKDATSLNIQPTDGSLMYVATELPTSGNAQPNRTAYPYFSWTPCLMCNRPRPPRCHHCPLCNKCILKRDHHCFITGVCVGYRNLRHFSVFLFWAMIGTLFGVLHAVPYSYYEVFPHCRYIDFLFPIAIIRAIFGYVEWQYVLLILIGWLCLFYLVWSFGFWKKLKVQIEEGKTSFEQDFKMDVWDTRGLSGRLKSVYGNYWLLNFIVPLHFVFEPIDDPVTWPHIRA